MIGFRNVIGHDYIEINKKTVYHILTAGDNEIKRVLSRIVEKNSLTTLLTGEGTTFTVPMPINQKRKEPREQRSPGLVYR